MAISFVSFNAYFDKRGFARFSSTHIKIKNSFWHLRQKLL